MKSKPITIVGGSFSVGKSTLMNTIQEKHGDAFHYIPDLARQILEERGGVEQVQQGGEESLRDFQLQVMEDYLRAETQAQSQEKPILSDGSLIEVLAYSPRILRANELQLLHNLIHCRKKIYHLVHLRPTEILLERDGVRHTDESFRSNIDQRVKAIAYIHHIPRFSVETSDLEKRYNIAIHTLLNA